MAAFDWTDPLIEKLKFLVDASRYFRVIIASPRRTQASSGVNSEILKNLPDSSCISFPARLLYFAAANSADAQDIITMHTSYLFSSLYLSLSLSG